MNEQLEFNDYTDKIVAFIDLQGFASKVDSIKDDPKRFNAIAEVVYAIKTLEEAEREKIFHNAHIPHDEIDPIKEGYECSVISDSIVFSLPNSKWSLFYISIQLARLQWELLWKWNYLVRGYVTSGKMYHKKNLLFGPAFQEAYKSAEENPMHVLPYILIKDKLFRELLDSNIYSPEVTNFLWNRDHLGRPFINYASVIDQGFTVEKLGIDTDQQAMNGMHFLQNNLSDKSLKHEIRDKYFWTYNYCNKVSKKMDAFKDKNLQKKIKHSKKTDSNSSSSRC